MRRRSLLRAAAAWPFTAIGTAGALATLVTTGAGCATFNDAPRFEFFVLDDLKASSAGEGLGPVAGGGPPSAGRVLLVSMGQSQALYDSDRMVFSPDGMSRAFFQYSNWSERPARRLAYLAERRLARSGGFDGVALSTAGIRGDTVLTLRLDELLLDETSRPPSIRLTVLAEMVDWRSRSLLGRRAFSRTMPAPTVDARGMARGATAALTDLLDELSAWVASTGATTRPKAPGQRGPAAG